MATRPAVIVTGGGSGIGQASVRRLLDQGWQVVAADRDPEALERTAASCADDGDRLSTALLDVTNEAMIDELVERTLRERGPVAGLVNSAGVGADATFLDTTAQMLRSVYEINLIGSFLVAKAVAKAMAQSGGGSIVNIGSVSGIAGNVGRAAYGASKAAITTLTKVMAVELAPLGIRVNIVAPGPIETPLVAAFHSKRMRQSWYRTVPMRRYGMPEEVAGAIAYLIDPDGSSYVTGQVIGVDGGFLAGGIID
ncbi:SDR family NAD(P)-dependent oxidoreductase [Geminicoccus roseus]|uniref:SDR family NAD(P)-dependent oxidoreductase n=1 Tax=Geminicoccus roseus TaxID=404900 RepID=UPI00040591AE|nr:SDR family NAD(P)-dependent oxidoreductase [Geminicoccus roseus]